jgi:hypothetical protein
MKMICGCTCCQLSVDFTGPKENVCVNIYNKISVKRWFSYPFLFIKLVPTTRLFRLLGPLCVHTLMLFIEITLFVELRRWEDGFGIGMHSKIYPAPFQSGL